MASANRVRGQTWEVALVRERCEQITRVVVRGARSEAVIGGVGSLKVIIVDVLQCEPVILPGSEVDHEGNPLLFCDLCARDRRRQGWDRCARRTAPVIEAGVPRAKGHAGRDGIAMIFSRPFCAGQLPCCEGCEGCERFFGPPVSGTSSRTLLDPPGPDVAVKGAESPAAR